MSGLKTYMETDDPNWFWRQSCGVHENLIDEATEEIERLREQVKGLTGLVWRLWSCDADLTRAEVAESIQAVCVKALAATEEE
jgi:hypothetical protein